MKTIQLATVLGALVAGAIAWSHIARRSSEHGYATASGGTPMEAPTTQRAQSLPAFDIPAEPAPDSPALSKADKSSLGVGSAPTHQGTDPKRANVERNGATSQKKTIAASASSTTGTPKGKAPPRDPAAREALYFVGSDPAAEEYWLDAINDPGLPEQERQDLIEDLNEDGLSDPHHPTIDDLPLIVSRIELLEEIGQDAMDQVNLDAFQEAYKDLLNLARAASGGAAP